jgi:hypothetical protein
MPETQIKTAQQGRDFHSLLSNSCLAVTRCLSKDLINFCVNF